MQKNFIKSKLYLPQNLRFIPSFAKHYQMNEYLFKPQNLKLHHFFSDSNHQIKKPLIYLYVPLPLIYFFLAEETIRQEPKIIYILDQKPQLSLLTIKRLKFILLWEKFRLGSDVESFIMRRKSLEYFFYPPILTIKDWLNALTNLPLRNLSKSKILILNSKT